jgi:hypothetical protein
MQPNEKTDDKENLQINQQPKKTWQEPVLTNLEINGGIDVYYFEDDYSYKYSDFY